MTLVKAHALGNDFLLIDAYDISVVQDAFEFARHVCDRHRGIGADGLISYQVREDGGVSMQLFNADGSFSEVSGNGVRCLAAWMAASRSLQTGDAIAIETDAGVKTLELLGVDHGRYTFCAAMGQPEQIARETIAVHGETVDAITLRVGNPQCVVLGEISEERLHTIAAGLAVHPRFPQGTNVELAKVEAPDRVRILIWERGVGPTEASGTGACAAAVASIQYGGAQPDIDIISPGGTQRVEWLEDGLFLTGWAEIIAECRWRRS